MALAVCLLFDRPGERAVRRLWGRLEDRGVPTLRSHTHGRHLPHLSYAVLRSWDADRVLEAVSALPDGGPVTFHLDGLGLFRRGRTWLVPAVTAAVAARQEAVVRAVAGTGADLHKHYLPGVWMPHVTLAPRVGRQALAAAAVTVYDVLPLTLTADRAALVDSGTGRVWPLPIVP